MYIQWSAVQVKNELSDAEKHRATQKTYQKHSSSEEVARSSTIADEEAA